MNCSCPRCNMTINGVFPHSCPSCGFSVSTLAGQGTSSFQQKNWKEHTDLLYGGTVGLYGKKYNASFNYKGVANLEDMVRFTITYGDTATIKDSRGIHDTQVILAYFPEVLGSGSAIYYHQMVPCSGLMVMSPSSLDHSHVFPVIDDWVQGTFPGRQSSCRLCGRPTDFGQPICADCYASGNNQWTELLKL